MPESPRTGHSFDTIPPGRVEGLAARTPTGEVRPAAVARARDRAVNRAYDDGAAVDEIAEQLLALSGPR